MNEVEDSVITTFIRRLNKLGIYVELNANVPWIYISRINNIKVTEKFQSEKAYTAFYLPVKAKEKIKFSDRRNVFNIVRKYYTKSMPIPEFYDRRVYKKKR